MRNRLFRVVCVWQDGDVEDADEVTVFAASEAEATVKAKKQWRLAVARRWSRCRLHEVLVLAKD